MKYVYKSIIRLCDVLKEGLLAHDLPGPIPIFSPFPSLYSASQAHSKAQSMQLLVGDVLYYTS